MKFIIYEDKAGEHRWRLVASNGKTVADSGEGYKNPGNVRRAIKSWREGVRNAPIGQVKPAAVVKESSHGEE